jgi:hypothetical protein
MYVYLPNFNSKLYLLINNLKILKWVLEQKNILILRVLAEILMLVQI